MRSAIIIVATAAFLFLNGAACAQMFKDIPEHEANIFPRNWRAEIVSDLRQSLLDTKGIRDPEISSPQLRHMGVASRYVVCIRMNARNAFGGYAGRQEYMAVFVRGQLSSIDRPTGGPMGQCATANYTPFPEVTKF